MKNCSNRASTPDTPNLVRAWGFAAAYKNTGLGGGAPDISGADVELYDDGTFEVRSSPPNWGRDLSPSCADRCRRNGLSHLNRCACWSWTPT